MAEPVRHRVGGTTSADADADVAEPQVRSARARLHLPRHGAGDGHLEGHAVSDDHDGVARLISRDPGALLVAEGVSMDDAGALRDPAIDVRVQPF